MWRRCGARCESYMGQSQSHL
eukprot:COSAG02_NODE_26414_length_633_cov_1.561798_1_plen_20_part_01